MKGWQISGNTHCSAAVAGTAAAVIKAICVTVIVQGMAFKWYHGKTGIIWNVTKRAVGVEINKQVRRCALSHLPQSVATAATKQTQQQQSRTSPAAAKQTQLASEAERREQLDIAIYPVRQGCDCDWLTADYGSAVAETKAATPSCS